MKKLCEDYSCVITSKSGNVRNLWEWEWSFLKPAFHAGLELIAILSTNKRRGLLNEHDYWLHAPVKKRVLNLENLLNKNNWCDSKWGQGNNQFLAPHNQDLLSLRAPEDLSELVIAEWSENLSPKFSYEWNEWTQLKY